MDIGNFLDKHEQKGLLRFITCGSVDDGKSTLIGRLLHDSKLLFTDQLSALQRDSWREGNAGEGEIDYALLLDGLKAEREQGITIDVAYRYFATPERKFIIADTPGHEQYTRNMATGASTADLAVILIDARQGVLTQTKRHSFIVSLLGIRQVVIAINKMDLVDYSEGVYNDIKAEYEQFVSQLDLPNIHYIPLSALRGDNVVDPSERMPWYDGPPLLRILETVETTDDDQLAHFRFPVQFVNRPNRDFRGFAGTVVSGIVRVGDRITALPSMRESAVKRIVTADGDLDEAFAPQAVTLELEDEIDVSSGEMLVHTGDLPSVGTHLEAIVIWMSDMPLRANGSYIIRQAGRTTKAHVRSLLYSVDVNTLQKQADDELPLNGIGKIALTTHLPLFSDSYSENRETGSFVLIDPISNGTVGAGTITGVLPAEEASSGAVAKDTEQSPLKSHVDRREFMWERGLVTPESRVAKNQHWGQAVVITGTRNSGKRELARRLELRLFKAGYYSYYLGISSLLEGLDADVGTSFWDRDEHIRRVGELCRIMTDAGLIFISSIDDADDYDLAKLKLLNSPNRVVVVTVGETPLADADVDIVIDAEADLAQATDEVLSALSRMNVLVEYYL